MSSRFSPEEVVSKLYEAVLRRSADEKGLAGWARVVRDTGDPMQVVVGLMESEEFRSFEPSPPLLPRRKWEWTGGANSVRFGAIAGLARSHAQAGLPQDLDVIVPACNSAAWLGVTCEALASFGIRPLYIVDASSSDDTLGLLQRRGERVFTLLNEGKCCESLLYQILPHLGSRWILRLDDDELPTRHTLDWVVANVEQVDEPVIGLPRRYVRSRDGKVWACDAADGSWAGDIQFRLFRPDEVIPTSALHTPAFELNRFRIAPMTAAFMHLDWLVRSLSDRLRKLERYEKLVPQSGWMHERLLLPERFSLDYYRDFHISDEVVERACRLLMERIPKQFR